MLVCIISLFFFQNCKSNKRRLNLSNSKSYIVMVYESSSESEHIILPQVLYLDSLSLCIEKTEIRDYNYFAEYISFWGFGLSNDLFNSFLCCKYGDVKEGIGNYFLNEAENKNQFSEFERLNSLNYQFRYKDAMILKFSKNDTKYKILVWSVNVQYCICDLYLDSFNQKLYSHKVIYISKKNETYRIDDSDKILFNKIIDNFLSDKFLKK